MVKAALIGEDVAARRTVSSDFRGHYVDYAKFIKKIELPNDFLAPDRLTFDELVAKPLTREHLEADLAAVNSSIEIIRKTRGRLLAGRATERGV